MDCDSDLLDADLGEQTQEWDPGTREIRLIDRCIVKERDSPDSRVDQNRGEIRVWKNHPDMRDLWVPLHHWNDERIVESYYPEDVTDEEYREFGRKIRDRGWACIDFRPQNIKKQGDDIRMVDFESCRPREQMEDWAVEQFDHRVRELE